MDRVFREKATSKSVKRGLRLEKAIYSLGKGNVFVIAEWDRVTRSMMDGIMIIQRVADRGATVNVLDKRWIDFTTQMGKGFIAFLSALVEYEREKITRRAKEGRSVAKARGVKFGPKPKLTDHQKNLALERLAEGDNYQSIAGDMIVSRTTFLRIR